MGWRRPWLGRLVLPGLAFVTAFAPSATGWTGLAWLPWYVPHALAGLAAAAAASVVAVRRWPLLLVAVLTLVLGGSGMPFAVLSYAVARHVPRHRLVYALAASALLFFEDPAVPWDSRAGGVLAFVWLPVVLGLWAEGRAQTEEELRERARAQERARIARDMHDVVAHRVSLMVLHAGALELNTADPEAAAQARLIRTTGKDAMVQLRQVLHALSRDEPDDGQGGLGDLDGLLDRSRAAGVPVTRAEHGTPRPLPPMVEQAAYRVVQEALTNVHKHAGPVPTEVELHYLAGALHVVVRNEPGPAPAGLPGSGLGLVGLRERARLLGGELSAEPTAAGGFLVTARLPT